MLEEEEVLRMKCWTCESPLPRRGSLQRDWHTTNRPSAYMHKPRNQLTHDPKWGNTHWRPLDDQCCTQSTQNTWRERWVQWSQGQAHNTEQELDTRGDPTEREGREVGFHWSYLSTSYRYRELVRNLLESSVVTPPTLLVQHDKDVESTSISRSGVTPAEIIGLITCLLEAADQVT